MTNKELFFHTFNGFPITDIKAMSMEDFKKWIDSPADYAKLVNNIGPSKYLIGGLHGDCPRCGNLLSTRDGETPTRFCRFCGQAVKWD